MRNCDICFVKLFEVNEIIIIGSSALFFFLAMVFCQIYLVFTLNFTSEIILQSQVISLASNQVSVFVSASYIVAQTCPRHWVPFFLAFWDSRGCGGSRYPFFLPSGTLGDVVEALQHTRWICEIIRHKCRVHKVHDIGLLLFMQDFCSNCLLFLLVS
jgi:hypothetical protein